MFSFLLIRWFVFWTEWKENWFCCLPFFFIFPLFPAPLHPYCPHSGPVLIIASWGSLRPLLTGPPGPPAIGHQSGICTKQVNKKRQQNKPSWDFVTPVLKKKSSPSIKKIMFQTMSMHLRPSMIFGPLLFSLWWSVHSNLMVLFI